MKALLGQSAASAIIRGLGMILSLLLSAVMANMLAPAGYGLYTFVLAVVALLSIPVKFGLPIHVTRETAQAMVRSDIPKVWALWFWAHQMVLLTGALVLISLASWLTLTANDEIEIWIWGGLLVPILALAHLRSAAIRGLGYALISQVPEMIFRPVLIIALAFGLFTLLGANFSAAQAVMLNVIGSALIFVLSVGFMIWRAPPRPPRKTWPRDKALTRAWFFSALTLGMAMGAQTIGGNMDVVMLGLLTDDAEVGNYKVALNGGSLVGFGLQSINMILLPRVAVLYTDGKTSELQKLVTAAARLALLFTFITCILLVFFGQWFIITLFGAEYADGYVTLLIIGGGQLIGAIFGSVMLVVNMTGNEKHALRGTIGFALLNILLNALLIPFAGKEGAAVATAVSLAVLNLYLWYIARNKADINTFAFGWPAGNPKGSGL
jgi:O-antigen/teichoic acid export membrane protein